MKHLAAFLAAFLMFSGAPLQAHPALYHKLEDLQDHIVQEHSGEASTVLAGSQQHQDQDTETDSINPQAILPPAFPVG